MKAVLPWPLLIIHLWLHVQRLLQNKVLAVKIIGQMICLLTFCCTVSIYLHKCYTCTPLSQDLHWFAILEALRPQSFTLLGRLHDLGMINWIIAHWWVNLISSGIFLPRGAGLGVILKIQPSNHLTGSTVNQPSPLGVLQKVPH